MRTCQINPSILSADFTNLERELTRIHTADAVHVDVMDNHFVPNLTIGLPVVQRLNEVSELPLDVHLMISDVDRWGPGYARGRRRLGHLPCRGLRGAGQAGPGPAGRRCTAAMALRPATPIEPYLDMLPELDMVLLMTVEPGFGGQAFLDMVLPKIRRARAGH